MSQDILIQIKATKQSLLNNAFLKLLVFPHQKDWYIEYGEGRFDSFCYDIFRRLEDGKESSQMMRGGIIAKPIDNKDHSPDVYSKIIEERKKIARTMIEVDYQSPLIDDRESLIMQLHLMWHLYETGISWPPSIEGMCLDLSFAKLLSAANRRIAADLTKAEQDVPRIRTGSQILQDKKVQRAQLIIESFMTLEFPKDSTLNKVAKMIYADLGTRVKVPPSVSTIKRVLKNNPEVWKNFTERKVKGKTFFIKQM